MTQATSQIGADQSGLAYRNADNAGKQALLNHHKGPAAPAYAEAGIIWLDDSATPWTLNVYTGTAWITLGEINAVTNSFQPYDGTGAPRMLNFAADTGTANAYAVAPAPAATAYAAGQIVTLKPAHANTGAATVNVNSLGAADIKLLDGSAPAADALLTTGVYTLCHDGTDFVVLNPSLPAFTGDSGAGGASGLVPAPAAGDAAAGKVLGASGAWVAGGAGITSVNRQIFTASGTYTPSAGLVYAEVEVLGGGGGASGGIAAVASIGAGGGAGGYSKSLLSAATIGAAQTITVGAGGAGGAAGGNGSGTFNYGDDGGGSSFGTLVTANGGGGSPYYTGGSYMNYGGAGGAAGTGDIAYGGASGTSSGYASHTYVIGDGGSTLYGSGGATRNSTSAGASASGYGAGGGGPGEKDLAGGDGAPGVVIVTEYIA